MRNVPFSGHGRSNQRTTILGKTLSFRRRTWPPSGKRDLLVGGRGRLRADATFSKKHSAILEKTSSSRRRTRQSSRRCDLLEEARDDPRENEIFSKVDATTLEKMWPSRRSAQPSSGKCRFLEEARDLLRENAIFSKEDVTSFEKTSSSRRSTYQRVPVNLLSSYWWGSGRDPKSGGGMRCFVAASYAEAIRNTIGSEKGRPKNMIPTGSFAGTGPDRRVPPGAAASRTRS